MKSLVKSAHLLSRTYKTITIKEALADPSLRIIDVRNPNEFEPAHLRMVCNFPLPTLKNNLQWMDKKGKFAFVCQSGIRSAQAAQLVESQGYLDVYTIDGGMNKVQNEIEPDRIVKASISSVWAMERQVRFAAGSMVTLGAIGGFLVNPMFFVLSGAVGAGLTFSAATNTCAMASVLAKAPWNQKK